MKTIEKLPSESARDYAFRFLKENIISMDLAPGTLISENEIAKELGLSRTPVRESIQELSKTAVIEIYPQKGSYVSLIDPIRVEEAIFLRKIMDTAVIEVACESVTEESLAKLEENVLLQEFYLQSLVANKILELDNAFHRMIYEATNKENIYKMMSDIMIQFDRVRTLTMKSVKDTKIVNDHRGMLEAIKAHDKETARQLVEKHLSRYHIDEAEVRAAFPSYFKD